MNLKLYHYAGKFLKWGFMAGVVLTHDLKTRRAQHGSSWVTRTRFYGLIHGIKPFLRAAAFVAVVVMTFVIFYSI